MQDKHRRTLRTAFQTLIAVAAMIPVLVPAFGLSAGPLAAAGAVIVAAATLVTRLVNEPAVENLLPEWLKATPTATQPAADPVVPVAVDPAPEPAAPVAPDVAPDPAP